MSCRIMITAVLADRKPVELHLFRNYLSASELLEPNTIDDLYITPPAMGDQHLWEAARASGAAPSYFRWQDKLLQQVCETKD